MPEYFFLVLVFLCSTASAAESLDAYAYQAEITQADAELQRLPIPMDVLLNITRSDLADIAVFDRHGNPLPHAVMKTLPTLSDEQIDLKIHSFDVYYSDHAKVVTTRQQRRQADGLSELETTETIDSKQRRTDYLLELPEDKALRQIELEWSQRPQNQLLHIRLEAGNELDKLHIIDNRKTLSNTNPGEPAWRTIDNIPARRKYLRITPAEPVEQFELQRATGHLQTSHAPARLKYQVEITEVTIKDRPYLYFETPSAVTPEALSIVPAQPHSMITASIFASSDDFEHRRQVRSGFRQHNIDSNEVDPNRPVTLPQRHYRHWWIALQEPTTATPEIHLHYPQYEILFLGNDHQPYSLAWGNYQKTVNTSALGGLIKTDLNQAGNRGVTVSLLQARAAGGDARLSPEATLPWKTWLLWLLLAAAATVTARMAFSLYREMNKPD